MAAEDSLLDAFGAGEEMADVEADEEVSDGSAEERAIGEMFDAGNAGDFAAATEAFKRAYKLCSSAKPAPMSEEPEETEDEGY